MNTQIHTLPNRPMHQVTHKSPFQCKSIHSLRQSKLALGLRHTAAPDLLLCCGIHTEHKLSHGQHGSLKFTTRRK